MDKNKEREERNIEGEEKKLWNSMADKKCITKEQAEDPAYGQRSVSNE